MIKCFILGHSFKRIGRQLIGICVERYVECRKCKKVIMNIQLHKKYFSVYETPPRPVYFERKPMIRIDKNAHEKMIKKMNEFIEKQTDCP